MIQACRFHLVGADAEIALASGRAGLQKAGGYAKDLLHDSILSQIILALHQLAMLVASAVPAQHYLGLIDPASKIDRFSKPCKGK